jgi:D-lactate dehydrogenase (cytochrome)
MEAGKLFGGRVIDTAGYLLERGLRLEAGEGSYLYHAPCHDSLEGKAKEVLTKIGGFGKISAVPHCCSEAGTLSLSRPDIADSMLHRKREALTEAMNGSANAVTLTNCPSCVQGLGRNRHIGIAALHILEALAEKHSGSEWKKRFLAQAARASAISF